MFSNMNGIFQLNISTGEALQNLIVALICGIILTFFYKKTYRGPGYLNSFVNSLLILTLITSLVIMVIGNNLARAFGLVGAMSIIRFRTAVKETQDIVYIFFSLAVGMAAGIGLHTLAVTATVFIGSVLLVLVKTNIISQNKKEFLLQFHSSQGTDSAEYMKIFENNCKSYDLINVKSLVEDGFLELSYYVTLKSKESGLNLVKELKKVNGINHVNLFFDEEYF